MRYTIVFGVALLLVSCGNDNPPAVDKAVTSDAQPHLPYPPSKAGNTMRRELDSLRDNTSGDRFGKSEPERYRVFTDLYELQDENRCIAEGMYPSLDFPAFDDYLNQLDANASRVIEKRHGLERTEVDQILIEAVAKNWYAQMKEKPCGK